MKEFEFDIALSFAGEDRSFAAALAKALIDRGVNVFYDDFEQANLWGKNLYDHLSEVYSKKAKFCIMFLSEQYAKKAWTNVERQSAQERAFRESKEYILPVRLDDTKIPGIHDTVGYIDLRSTSIEELTDMVLRKLNVSSNEKEIVTPGNTFTIHMPKIKKTFSNLEKDKFLKQSFETIKKYFEHGLVEIQKQNSGLYADFEEISKYKFICKIYLNGDLKCKCKIWVGGMFSAEAIRYSESAVDPHQDNSYNESLTIESDGYSLFWKALMTDFFSNNILQEKAQATNAAEFLWIRFIRPLSC